MEITAEERERIRQTFYAEAAKLKKRHGATIPSIRKTLHEILDVSV